VYRKRLLLALMTLFVAGNLACGLAPSFAVLLVARVATSFSHAAFAGAGIALAIGLVEERRQGSATAVSSAGPRWRWPLGVPLGTFLGEHFGWRTASLRGRAVRDDRPRR
jgi:MFS transporter, DHA1 family, inner membrane transport protein